MTAHRPDIAEDLLRPGEAAARLGVTPSALAKAADRGLIAHVRTLGGHRRFRPADLEAFLETNTHPVQEDRAP